MLKYFKPNYSCDGKTEFTAAVTLQTFMW